jgi:hypothetical protein
MEIKKLYGNSAQISQRAQIFLIDKMELCRKVVGRWERTEVTP